MKTKNILLVSLAPLGLMAYGWILGQRHQSGYDIAGILLFITGAIGLIPSFAIHVLTRKYAWHDFWAVQVLSGIAGCGIVLVLVMLYSSLHG